MEEPVTIVDREVLKVLAVDTRMDILKELSKGARMPSFLGKKLNKSDATIVEHLNKLEKAGLVKRIEAPGKRFVFYTLTRRGMSIVSSRSRRLVIILALSAVTFIGGFASLAKHWFDYMHLAGTFAAREVAPGVGEAAKAPLPVNATTTTVPTETLIAQLTAQPIYLYLAITLFTISTVCFIYYLVKKVSM